MINTIANLKSAYIKLYRSKELPVWCKDNDLADYGSLLEYIRPIDNKSAIDIGCGFGNYTRFLSNAGFKHVVGIDFVEDAIEKAVKTPCPNTTFINDDFFHWVTEKKFDFFFDRGVFTHLNEGEVTHYLNNLDELGNADYSILITCFEENYYQEESQMGKKDFFYKDIYFRKYSEKEITELLSPKFKILKTKKDIKADNRTFWHVLAKRTW